MPVLLVASNVDVDAAVLDRLAKIAGDALDISSARVMVLAAPVSASLGGNCRGVALLELRCARVLDVEERRNLVRGIAQEVSASLGVEETRIYVQVESRNADALWRSAGGFALHAGERS